MNLENFVLGLICGFASSGTPVNYIIVKRLAEASAKASIAEAFDKLQMKGVISIDSEGVIKHISHDMDLELNDGAT